MPFGSTFTTDRVDYAGPSVAKTLSKTEARERGTYISRFTAFEREFVMPVVRRKISAFDAETLKVLENLSDATWLIFEARHPFRDIKRDDSLRQSLRLKLFIHAENSGFENLDAIQQFVLESMSRESDQTD